MHHRTTWRYGNLENTVVSELTTISQVPSQSEIRRENEASQSYMVINNPLHFVNFYCHINNNDWDSQWLCLITYRKHHNKHKYILEIYGKSLWKTKREFRGVLSGIWFHLMCRDYTWESSLFHWAFLYLALHAWVCKVLGKSFSSTLCEEPFWAFL